MDDATLFVVKAVGPHGTSWLTVPNDYGMRSLGAREAADVVHSRRDADIAIAKMPHAFVKAGLVFSVEAAAN
jgi:hypothetical protein